MNKIHEKSSCCRAPVRLFGGRRRQCSSCKKTWRVWQRKHGRKHIRQSINQLFKYMEGKLNNSCIEKRTLAARLRSTLTKFNEKNSWPEIPNGPLIAIADGLIQYFGKKKYTVYFILLRGVHENKAIILPPYLRTEGEVVLGWKEAFNFVPDSILQRIKVLVCDGHGGLIYLAKECSWEIQRCHFHLLARIAHNASIGSLNRSKGIGQNVKNLAQIVLYQRNHIKVRLALKELEEIKKQITSRLLRSVISGFIKHHEDFRTYIKFPQYHIPTTSNSAEYLVGCVRRLQYRARGFKTPASLFRWVTGLCKYKKSVTCRGKIQPN